MLLKIDLLKTKKLKIVPLMVKKKQYIDPQQIICSYYYYGGCSSHTLINTQMPLCNRSPPISPSLPHFFPSNFPQEFLADFLMPRFLSEIGGFQFPGRSRY